MTGSSLARVLVALCIGSAAVHCMPKATHKSRRQAQQHHVSSVTQGELASLNFVVVYVVWSTLTGDATKNPNNFLFSFLKTRIAS